MAGWSMALRPLILPGCRAGSSAVTVPMATAALEKSCQHLWLPGETGGLDGQITWGMELCFSSEAVLWF